MYIEIRKAGFRNKGAELMLHAVLDKVRAEFPDAKMVMAPGTNRSAYPYSSRAPLGLYQKAWLWAGGLQIGDAAFLVPKKIREMYGVILDREVGVVLDAAGFAYSDQLGLESTLELSRAAGRWRKQRTKLIMLPQAFGPFESKKSKNAIEKAIDCAALVFTRDAVSYDHLTSVVGEKENIKIAPDFTNLSCQLASADEQNLYGDRIAIIPNFRMIDKRGGGRKYMAMMDRVTKMLVDRGEDVFVIMHEDLSDAILCRQLSEENNVPLLRESNPLVVKQIIGGCKGIVSSRFHGLVSALSQGVPALATSWSHKYYELMREYGVSDCILQDDMADVELRFALDRLLEMCSSETGRSGILGKSELFKSKVEDMWEEVYSVIRESNDGRS